MRMRTMKWRVALPSPPLPPMAPGDRFDSARTLRGPRAFTRPAPVVILFLRRPRAASEGGSPMARSVYDEVYARSMKDPEGFWSRAAEDIHWEKRCDRVFDDSRKPFVRWFAGGVLNTCYNALDLHIERGRGKQRALVYDSPVTSTVKVFTYDELRDAVARVAGALRRQGIAKGDRVIIYMPMVPEAVMAMLACARIGAIHSVVFGGFAPNERSEEHTYELQSQSN